MNPRLWCALCVIGFSGMAQAQVVGVDAFERLLAEKKTGQPVLLSADKEIGRKYNVVLLTATLPVGFTELRLKDGAATLGAKLEAGAGAAVMVGKGIYNGPGQLTLFPMVMLGASLNTGVSSNTSIGSSESGVAGRLGVSGFVGLGPVAISIGRDFLTNSTFFGLSARIDAFVFNEDAFIPFAVW